MRELLYGRQAVREALRAGKRRVYRLLFREGGARAPILDDITALAQQRRVRIETLPRQALDSLAQNTEHQGILLEVEPFPYAEVVDMLTLARERAVAPLLLLLDQIQDVHNLGSLLRSAEAVGVHGVLVQERRAAGITPAAVHTSAGAVEHLLVAQVANLSQAMERLKTAGLWFAGLEDVPGALAYTTVDLTIPLGLVVGSEGAGMRRLVRERCDWLLALPMCGHINSLNAAVAGSIALYEVLRQRRV